MHGKNHNRPAFALCATALATLLFSITRSSADTESSESAKRRGTLRARVLANGIPGAGAVAEVGDFLRGSPIHDNAAFTGFGQPGQVLEPRRILVASTSNFGAPLAHPKDPEGAILSIDPSSVPVDVPAALPPPGASPPLWAAPCNCTRHRVRRS